MLLGGTYILLFYMGMLIKKHGLLEDTSLRKSAAAFVSGCVGWVIVWRFLCENGLKLDTYIPYGAGFNPPGISFFALTFCTLPAVFGFCTLLKRCRFLNRIPMALGWLGTRTMGIFLYHLFVLNQFRRYWPLLESEHIWIARVLFFSGMIFLSMGIQRAVEWLLRFIQKVMEGRELQ